MYLFTYLLHVCFIFCNFLFCTSATKNAIKDSILRHSSNNITSHSWLHIGRKVCCACTVREERRFCRQCDTCHEKLTRAICRKLQTSYSWSSVLRLTRYGCRIDGNRRKLDNKVKPKFIPTFAERPNTTLHCGKGQFHSHRRHDH